MHPERNELAKKEGWFWEGHPKNSIGADGHEPKNS